MNSFSPLRSVRQQNKIISKQKVSQITRAIDDLKHENHQYKSTMDKLLTSTEAVLQANERLQEGISERRAFLQETADKLCETSQYYDQALKYRHVAIHRLRKYQRQFDKKTNGVDRENITTEIQRIKDELRRLKQEANQCKEMRTNQEEVIRQIRNLHGLKNDLVEMNEKLTKEAFKYFSMIDFAKLRISPELEKQIVMLQSKMQRSEMLKQQLLGTTDDFDEATSEFFNSIDTKFQRALPIFSDLEHLLETNARTSIGSQLTSQGLSDLLSQGFSSTDENTSRQQNKTGIPLIKFTTRTSHNINLLNQPQSARNRPISVNGMPGDILKKGNADRRLIFQPSSSSASSKSSFAEYISSSAILIDESKISNEIVSQEQTKGRKPTLDPINHSKPSNLDDLSPQMLSTTSSQEYNLQSEDEILKDQNTSSSMKEETEIKIHDQLDDSEKIIQNAEISDSKNQKPSLLESIHSLSGSDKGKKSVLSPIHKKPVSKRPQQVIPNITNLKNALDSLSDNGKRSSRSSKSARSDTSKNNSTLRNLKLELAKEKDENKVELLSECEDSNKSGDKSASTNIKDQNQSQNTETKEEHHQSEERIKTRAILSKEKDQEKKTQSKETRETKTQEENKQVEANNKRTGDKTPKYTLNRENKKDEDIYDSDKEESKKSSKKKSQEQDLSDALSDSLQTLDDQFRLSGGNSKSNDGDIKNPKNKHQQKNNEKFKKSKKVEEIENDSDGEKDTDKKSKAKSKKDVKTKQGNDDFDEDEKIISNAIKHKDKKSTKNVKNNELGRDMDSEEHDIKKREDKHSKKDEQKSKTSSNMEPDSLIKDEKKDKYNKKTEKGKKDKVYPEEYADENSIEEEFSDNDGVINTKKSHHGHESKKLERDDIHDLENKGSSHQASSSKSKNKKEKSQKVNDGYDSEQEGMNKSLTDEEINNQDSQQGNEATRGTKKKNTEKRNKENKKKSYVDEDFIQSGSEKVSSEEEVANEETKVRSNNSIAKEKNAKRVKDVKNKKHANKEVIDDKSDGDDNFEISKRSTKKNKKKTNNIIEGSAGSEEEEENENKQDYNKNKEKLTRINDKSRKTYEEHKQTKSSNNNESSDIINSEEESFDVETKDSVNTLGIEGKAKNQKDKHKEGHKSFINPEKDKKKRTGLEYSEDINENEHKNGTKKRIKNDNINDEENGKEENNETNKRKAHKNKESSEIRSENDIGISSKNKFNKKNKGDQPHSESEVLDDRLDGPKKSSSIKNKSISKSHKNEKQPQSYSDDINEKQDDNNDEIPSKSKSSKSRNISKSHKIKNQRQHSDSENMNESHDNDRDGNSDNKRSKKHDTSKSKVISKSHVKDPNVQSYSDNEILDNSNKKPSSSNRKTIAKSHRRNKDQKQHDFSEDMDENDYSDSDEDDNYNDKHNKNITVSKLHNKSKDKYPHSDSEILDENNEKAKISNSTKTDFKAHKNLKAKLISESEDMSENNDNENLNAKNEKLSKNKSISKSKSKRKEEQPHSDSEAHDNNTERAKKHSSSKNKIISRSHNRKDQLHDSDSKDINEDYESDNDSEINNESNKKQKKHVSTNPKSHKKQKDQHNENENISEDKSTRTDPSSQTTHPKKSIKNKSNKGETNDNVSSELDEDEKDFTKKKSKNTRKGSRHKENDSDDDEASSDQEVDRNNSKKQARNKNETKSKHKKTQNESDEEGKDEPNNLTNKKTQRNKTKHRQSSEEEVDDEQNEETKSQRIKSRGIKAKGGKTNTKNNEKEESPKKSKTKGNEQETNLNNDKPAKSRRRKQKDDGNMIVQDDTDIFSHDSMYSPVSFEKISFQPSTSNIMEEDESTSESERIVFDSPIKQVILSDGEDAEEEQKELENLIDRIQNRPVLNTEEENLTNDNEKEIKTKSTTKRIKAQNSSEDGVEEEENNEEEDNEIPEDSEIDSNGVITKKTSKSKRKSHNKVSGKERGINEPDSHTKGQLNKKKKSKQILDNNEEESEDELGEQKEKILKKKTKTISNKKTEENIDDLDVDPSKAKPKRKSKTNHISDNDESEDELGEVERKINPKRKSKAQDVSGSENAEESENELMDAKGKANSKRKSKRRSISSNEEDKVKNKSTIGKNAKIKQVSNNEEENDQKEKSDDMIPMNKRKNQKTNKKIKAKGQNPLIESEEMSSNIEIPNESNKRKQKVKIDDSLRKRKKIRTNRKSHSEEDFAPGQSSKNIKNQDDTIRKLSSQSDDGQEFDPRPKTRRRIRKRSRSASEEIVDYSNHSQGENSQSDSDTIKSIINKLNKYSGSDVEGQSHKKTRKTRPNISNEEESQIDNEEDESETEENALNSKSKNTKKKSIPTKRKQRKNKEEINEEQMGSDEEDETEIISNKAKAKQVRKNKTQRRKPNIISASEEEDYDFAEEEFFEEEAELNYQPKKRKIKKHHAKEDIQEEESDNEVPHHPNVKHHRTMNDVLQDEDEISKEIRQRSFKSKSQGALLKSEEDKITSNKRTLTGEEEEEEEPAAEINSKRKHKFKSRLEELLSGDFGPIIEENTPPKRRMKAIPENDKEKPKKKKRRKRKKTKGIDIDESVPGQNKAKRVMAMQTFNVLPKYIPPPSAPNLIPGSQSFRQIKSFGEHNSIVNLANKFRNGESDNNLWSTFSDDDSVQQAPSSPSRNGFYPTETMENLFIAAEQQEKESKKGKNKRQKTSRTQWANSLLQQAISQQVDRTRLQIAITDAQFELSKINDEITDLEDKLLLANFQKKYKQRKSELRLKVNSIYIPPSLVVTTSKWKVTKLTQHPFSNQKFEQLLGSIQDNNHMLSQHTFVQQDKLVAESQYPRLEKSLTQRKRMNARLATQIEELERRIDLVTPTNDSTKVKSKEKRARLRYERAVEERKLDNKDIDHRLALKMAEAKNLNERIKDQRQLTETLKAKISEVSRATKPNVKLLIQEKNGYKGLCDSNYEKSKMLEIELNWIESQIKELESCTSKILVMQRDQDAMRESIMKMKDKLKLHCITSYNELKFIKIRTTEINSSIERMKKAEKLLNAKIQDFTDKLIHYKIAVPYNKDLIQTDVI